MPASFLSIIIATVISVVMKLDVETVGAIPKTLFLEDRLDIAALNFQDIKGLFGPAVSIAMLGMIESLLCGASAGKMANVRLNSDQELVAQGIGNIILPFSGDSRNCGHCQDERCAEIRGAHKADRDIPCAGASCFYVYPGACDGKDSPVRLAGVLMVTAFRMNDWKEIRYIFSHHFKGAAAKYLITMAATILFDLTTAILLGVVTGLVLLVSRLSHIEINYEKVDMSRINNADERLNKKYENAAVAYLTGTIIFANTQNIEEILVKMQEFDTVLLSMRGVSYMDISGAITFMQVLAELQKQGKKIFLCGVPNSTMMMLKRSGIYDMIGENNFYWSVERALLD